MPVNYLPIFGLCSARALLSAYGARALCCVCLPPKPDTRAKFQIDLEPDTNANLMQNITFRRVQTRNNYECGFSFALYACTVPEAPASVTLEDCHSIGDRMGSFNVESISSNVSGHILLKDCSSTGGSGPGLWIRGKDAQGASLQVTNMRLVNTATKMWIADGAAGRFPVSISVNGKNIGAQGGVHFTNLTVIDQLETLPGGSLPPGPLEATSKRAWLNATVPKGLAGISGDVTVVNSHGCSEIVKVGAGAAKDVSLKVTCKQDEHEHEQAQGGSMDTRHRTSRGEDRLPLKNDDDAGHSKTPTSWFFRPSAASDAHHHRPTDGGGSASSAVHDIVVNDGKSYGTAWTHKISWASIKPGDTLFVCGFCSGLFSLPAGFSGTPGAGGEVTINGNCPRPDGSVDRALWVGGELISSFPSSRWSGPDAAGIYTMASSSTAGAGLGFAVAPNTSEMNRLTRLDSHNSHLFFCEPLCSFRFRFDPRLSCHFRSFKQCSCFERNHMNDD